MNPKKSRHTKRYLRDNLFALDQTIVDAHIAALELTEDDYGTAYEGFEMGLLYVLSQNMRYPEGVAPPTIIYPPGALPFLLQRCGFELSDLQAFCE